jgi:hypothetical protein
MMTTVLIVRVVLRTWQREGGETVEILKHSRGIKGTRRVQYRLVGYGNDAESAS